MTYKRLLNCEVHGRLVLNGERKAKEAEAEASGRWERMPVVLFTLIVGPRCAVPESPKLSGFRVMRSVSREISSNLLKKRLSCLMSVAISKVQRGKSPRETESAFNTRTGLQQLKSDETGTFKYDISFPFFNLLPCFLFGVGVVRGRF